MVAGQKGALKDAEPRQTVFRYLSILGGASFHYSQRPHRPPIAATCRWQKS